MAEFVTFAQMRRETGMSRKINPLALAVAVASAAPALAAGDAKDVVAAQIRRQGFRCDSSKGAARAVEDSKPVVATWILECRNATYRVQLVPHMAARVELVPLPAPAQKDPALLGQHDGK
ncbi:MAG TPA: hypothetical protein VEH76_07675 [Methylocystis sp.]|nr:hypothetical protein [Methylocystis sp.]